MLVYMDTASVVTIRTVDGSGGSLSIMPRRSLLFFRYVGRYFVKG